MLSGHGAPGVRHRVQRRVSLAADGGGGQPLDQELAGEQGQAGEKVVGAVDVLVERRLRDPEAARDARHAERVEPLLRSEEHTSELQSLMRISYAVLCLKNKKTNQRTYTEQVCDMCT